jgi:hypothetical protein
MRWGDGEMGDEEMRGWGDKRPQLPISLWVDVEHPTPILGLAGVLLSMAVYWYWRTYMRSK